VKIQFAPTAIGTANAELTFPNSGPCQDAAVVIDFSGQGIVNAVQPTVTADGFSLGQNYPNPFVNSTTFNYSIPNNEEDIIKITLTDMTGKTVKTLISGAVSGGDHSVTFDASQLSSGTYVYRLESGATRLSKVLVLSK
jgi:flagellar hook assembly protein FlgD